MFEIDTGGVVAQVRALYEAYGTSKAVDYFDLRSEDSASVERWSKLLQSQRKAFRELHEVCRQVPVEDLMDYEN